MARHYRGGASRETVPSACIGQNWSSRFSPLQAQRFAATKGQISQPLLPRHLFWRDRLAAAGLFAKRSSQVAADHCNCSCILERSKTGADDQRREAVAEVMCGSTLAGPADPRAVPLAKAPMMVDAQVGQDSCRPAESIRLQLVDDIHHAWNGSIER